MARSPCQMSSLRRSRLSASPAIGTGATVARLVEEHGDAKMTELIVTLANCPKARSASIYDRCNAVYEGLTSR